MSDFPSDAPPRRRADTAGGRVPPHNLQAEESLLGAMLLSKDAIAAAVEVVNADDFYKPAHGHVFEAITALYSGGEPVDPVTVAEELRRAGLLDAIGGAGLLVTLQSATPATTSASRYARIVEENALLRRLIWVAGEVAEKAYSLPDDVTKAVDEAESLVFGVAQRRVTDTTAPIGELLDLTLDRLEELYERGEAITGVPTGFLDLDELLSGMQPSALLVVGARPSMGKALSLDTPIPTPGGWTTMGDLHVDDSVLDDKGQPCRVTYTTPVQHDRRCYEVEFDDGSVIVADAEHQWFAYDLPAWKSLRGRHYRTVATGSLDGYNPNLARDQSARRREPRVVTTEQMLQEGVRVSGDARPNWYVPLAQQLELPERDVPIDPYVLGCWLGDGRSAGSDITIGDEDCAHFRDEFTSAGYAFERPCALQWATVPVAGKGAWQGYRGSTRVLTRELQAVGLLGGVVKHIPAAYLRGSAKQRLALLQGLMDTDGCVTNGNGTVELCLANRALLVQARELVCSLGHKPSQIRKKTIQLPDGRTATAFRTRWTPLDPVFRLARKAERLEATRSKRTFGRMTRRAVTAIRPVASVPVRCITVDSPNHLYLAGESMIPTHNTAFALGMATHAALEAQKPVLLFSLEMSQMEVTQRILCSEARVDAQRVRNGRLAEADWAKLHHAVGRLATAPIYIDDNPNITVMDIRAKSRRLKSRVGELGVVIIDYIQLMSGRGGAENRQVEVSEISRNLKILARELETPVVALAQLNRQLETRADKRPMLADLRESGCLTADTLVTRADTGARVSMGELLLTGERNIPVWSLDDDLKLVPATMTHVFPSGVKDVFALRLASGRTVKASANHPFRTLDGWTRLDELQPGTRLAVPRTVPAPANQEQWPKPELVMLAHLLGDGCVASRQPVHYTSEDPENLDAVAEAAEHFGITPRLVRQERWWHLYLPSPYRLTHGKRNPIQQWLSRFGLDGLRSHEKFIPREIFGLGDDQIALFLRHLWATDGCVALRGRLASVYYASTSRRMITDLQELLLRFGIQSRLKSSQKGQHRVGYQLWIYGAQNQLRLLEGIGVHGARGALAQERVIPMLRTIVANTNRDTVPVAVWGSVKERMAARGVTARSLAAGLETAYCGSTLYEHAPSRGRLAQVAAIVDDDELRALASSDVFWDEVVSIAPVGREPVYDATVLGTHNFVADGICVHNSIEQDADVVLFLYRDEVYNPETPDRGTAEVIVAKHRSGPTGKVRLAWLDHYTKFANMARGV